MLLLSGSRTDEAGRKEFSYDQALAFQAKTLALDADLKRSDFNEINELLEKAGATGEKKTYCLKNKYLGYYAPGLGLDRMVPFLRKAAAPFMGRDDIVDMITKLAAPQFPENQGLEAGSPQLEKLNREFREAVATYKKILLYNFRCAANTFGNIPQQLSMEDFKKFAHLYGDMYRVHTDGSQDVIQLTRFDHYKQFFNPETNADDKELDFLNHYYAVQRSAFGIALMNYVIGQDDAVQILTTNIKNTFTDHPTFFTANIENNSIMKGRPSMTAKQKAAYMKKQRAALLQNDYRSYREQRRAFEDQFNNALMLWSKQNLTKFKPHMSKTDSNEILPVKRDLEDMLKTLNILKASPLWEHPEQARNREIKKLILSAKRNENYIKDLDQAMTMRLQMAILAEDPNVGTKHEKYIKAKAAFDAFAPNVIVRDVHNQELGLINQH